MATDEDIRFHWCEICDQAILPSQEEKIIEGYDGMGKLVVHLKCCEGQNLNEKA